MLIPIHQVLALCSQTTHTHTHTRTIPHHTIPHPACSNLGRNIVHLTLYLRPGSKPKAPRRHYCHSFILHSFIHSFNLFKKYVLNVFLCPRQISGMKQSRITFEGVIPKPKYKCRQWRWCFRFQVPKYTHRHTHTHKHTWNSPDLHTYTQSLADFKGPKCLCMKYKINELNLWPLH